MSAYNARRAPNVSRYLANLNTMQSPREVAAQQQHHQQQSLGLGDDSLDFLTTAEFFDFDQFNPNAAAAAAFDAHTIPNNMKDASQFTYDFNAFQANDITSPSTLAPSPQNGLAAGFQLPSQHYTASDSSPVTGDKRKASVALHGPPFPGSMGGVPADLEEVTRMAAEEDKRRRNTAASARFRVKKKQREQALEKTTKEMSDKVSSLESKILQLEMENKWLKELITEKAGAGASEGSSNANKAETTSSGEASIEDQVSASSREAQDSSEQTA